MHESTVAAGGDLVQVPVRNGTFPIRNQRKLSRFHREMSSVATYLHVEAGGGGDGRRGLEGRDELCAERGTFKPFPYEVLMFFSDF